LGKNDTLKVLDLSFNSMGNSDMDLFKPENEKSELIRRKKE
jgi:hypothetical protein